MRVLRDRTVYGLGRTRSSDPQGRVAGYHLNPYVNCIHANAGGGLGNNAHPGNRNRRLVVIIENGYH
jgi:hypothetical protein